MSPYVTLDVEQLANIMSAGAISIYVFKSFCFSDPHSIVLILACKCRLILSAVFHPATADECFQGGRDRAGTPVCTGLADWRQTETEQLLIDDDDESMLLMSNVSGPVHVINVE